MKIRDRVVFPDGFSMSIQASEYHYCAPRDNVGPYTEVEVGYPSQAEPLLEEYSDGCGVFAYVPKEVILEIARKHGLKELEI